MKEAVEKIVSALVDDKEAVRSVGRNERTGDCHKTARRVGDSDMGRIIGREGRTVKAIRSLAVRRRTKTRQAVRARYCRVAACRISVWFYGEDLVAIAKLAKPRGLRGEIVADVLTDFPERFDNLETVFAVRAER